MLDRDHLASLQPPAVPLNRRTLVKASLSAGFCAAVAPVWAQIVTTPADGLTAGEVKIPSSGVDVPGYRAMPDHGGPFPTVLVVHEIFGVHEHIKDVCRRWAKLGYYAIAPDLFARHGDASKESDMGKLMSDIVGKTSDPEVSADLDATLAFAKASGVERRGARRSHRFLLGRASGLALCRAQSGAQGRRRLVRTAGQQCERLKGEAESIYRCQNENAGGPRTGPVRRPG